MKIGNVPSGPLPQERMRSIDLVELPLPDPYEEHVSQRASRSYLRAVCACEYMTFAARSCSRNVVHTLGGRLAISYASTMGLRVKLGTGMIECAGRDSRRDTVMESWNERDRNGRYARLSTFQ